MSELREQYEILKSQIWHRIHKKLEQAENVIHLEEYSWITDPEIDFINEAGQLFAVRLTRIYKESKGLTGIDDEGKECYNSLYDIISVDDRLTILELLEEIYD